MVGQRCEPEERTKVEDRKKIKIASIDLNFIYHAGPRADFDAIDSNQ
jgi:hypothetical protein